VNAEKLERFASIPEQEKRLAEAVLFDADQSHIAAIAEHFRGATARAKPNTDDLPLDRRLANYIVEGTKDGLIADLDRKLAEGARRSISLTVSDGRDE